MIQPVSLRALAAPFLVYTAAILLANAAAADEPGLGALREGDMRRLLVHEAAVPAPETPYTAADGSETTLSASNGRVRVVNFWATWCAPCREEMPSLEALHADLGGPDFEVILIATGRNSPDAIERFFAEEGIDALETGLDPKSRLAQAMGVPGLPVTVILDREGAEVARLLGGADWAGESARNVVAALLAR